VHVHDCNVSCDFCAGLAAMQDKPWRAAAVYMPLLDRGLCRQMLTASPMHTASHHCMIAQIMDGGKLWDQDKPTLIGNMRSAVEVRVCRCATHMFHLVMLRSTDLCNWNRRGGKKGCLASAPQQSTIPPVCLHGTAGPDKPAQCVCGPCGSVRPACLHHNVSWANPAGPPQVCRIYKEQYKAAKELLATQPKSKQFDFDEQARTPSWQHVSAEVATLIMGTLARLPAQDGAHTEWTTMHVIGPWRYLLSVPHIQAIFVKSDLFIKRLNKLIDVFTTIHQFSSLEAHTHIEGLETLIRSLNNIIDDVKRKPYDLLDFFRNQVSRGVFVHLVGGWQAGWTGATDLAQNISAAACDWSWPPFA
jgi:hypothetical protein